MADMRQKTFRPGETVPRSGIYKVYHNSHRLMHEATLVEGIRFPFCKQCKHKARFQQVRAVGPDSSGRVIPSSTHVLFEEWPGGSVAMAA